jgi:hypothetical protein
MGYFGEVIMKMEIMLKQLNIMMLLGLHLLQQDTLVEIMLLENIQKSGILNERNTMTFSINSRMKGESNPFTYQECYIVCSWDNGNIFGNYAGLFTGGVRYAIQLLGGQNTDKFYTPPRGSINVNGYSHNNNTESIITKIQNGGIINQSRTQVILNGWAIGSQSDHTDNRGWVGKIAEVIVFDTTQTQENRAKIEGYLAHKWGLENKLPNNHTYKNSTPIN